MRNLPPRPNLEFLRRRARRLRARVRAGDPSATALAHHYDPALPADPAFPAPFSILDAQRVVARDHGFRSWTALVRYVEAAGGPAPADPALAAHLLDVLARIRETHASVRAGAERFDPHVVDAQARAADALHEVLDDGGWPTVARVGHAAAEATMSIVGSAWTRASLSHRARPLLAERVRRGEAPGFWFALLADQADCLSLRPVRYGLVGDFDELGRLTVGNDVVDPPNLDRRRGAFGIDPVAAERARVLAEAAERGDVRVDRQRYEDDKRETALRGGWI